MATLNEVEKKIKRAEDVLQPQTIPYIVYENAETRHERREKRTLLWVVIPLIAALLFSNMAWLYVWQQYDYSSYELSTEGGGNANYIGNDGDINNGARESKGKN